VFFTTQQKLLNEDERGAQPLRVRSGRSQGRKAHPALQGSEPATEGANVMAFCVRRGREIVYFVATGVLTTVANGNGESATKAAE